MRQALAAATLGTAAWFLYLQAVELGAFCKWCMSARARRGGRGAPPSSAMAGWGA